MDAKDYIDKGQNPPWWPDPFRWRLKEVDENTWILDGIFLISRHSSQPSEHSWSDGEGGFFAINPVPSPAPPCRDLSDGHPFRQISESDYNGASWNIGDAVLDAYEQNDEKYTPEHVALEALRKRTWSFQIPDTYYHGYHDGFYIIVYSKLKGTLLSDAWEDNTNAAYRERVAREVALAHQEMSTWESDVMSGLNGSESTEVYLSHRGGDESLDHDHLIENCRSMGMDCSRLVFNHGRLAPQCITVDENGGLVGFESWDCSGFVPKDWILTHLGFDPTLQGAPHWKHESTVEWQKMLQPEMCKLGFRQVVDAFLAFDAAGSRNLQA